MPLTKSGEKVMEAMKKRYGTKKGKSVFYASINKGKSGSEDWHMKKKEMVMDRMKKRMKK